MMTCCNCSGTATTTSPRKIFHAWWMLKLAYGGLFIAAGADKFFNLIAPWSKYVSPLIFQHIHIETATLLLGIAVFEILLGIMILTCATRFGAHLASLWLLIIAANLLSMGYPYDIAVRDIIMAVGACALGCLSASRSDIATGQISR